MIPVFVINLARAHDRRARIAGHLADLGIAARFLPAVDGSSLHLSAFSRTYRRQLVPGEIGTYLSHIDAAKMIAESGEAFVCLLEDDAELTPEVLPFLEPGVLRTLPGFDILRLVTGWHGKRKTLAKVGNVSVCAPLYPGANGHAQIYSRAGAAKIAKYLPARDPIDVALFFNPPVRRFRLLDVEELITRQVGESGVDPHGLVRAQPDNGWGSFQGRVHRFKHHVNFMLTWGLHYFSMQHAGTR
jgi:GR25 family glycosyltransferase involved in LPS biosynthesis